MNHQVLSLEQPTRARRTWSGTRDKFGQFFFNPASPLPLAVLRISLAILLLVQVYSLRDSFIPLFSRGGLIQGPLADALRSPFLPHAGWLAEWLYPYGISEHTVLYGVGIAYTVSLVLFGVGLFTRVAAVATWFLHWVLMATCFSTAYGVDLYAHVFLFYLMWMPVGRALSLDNYFAKRPLIGHPTWDARLGLRVLQLHLCVSYAASAVDKVQGLQWRTGEVLWRSLTLPIFKQYDMTWLANWPSILFTASWATLILEGLFFIFIWPKTTRKLWLAGILGLHLGIAIFLGLHLFGLVMCALVASVFWESKALYAEARDDGSMLVRDLTSSTAPDFSDAGALANPYSRST